MSKYGSMISKEKLEGLSQEQANKVEVTLYTKL